MLSLQIDDSAANDYSTVLTTTFEDKVDAEAVVATFTAACKSRRLDARATVTRVFVRTGLKQRAHVVGGFSKLDRIESGEGMENNGSVDQARTEEQTLGACSTTEGSKKGASNLMRSRSEAAGEIPRRRVPSEPDGLAGNSGGSPSVAAGVGS